MGVQKLSWCFPVQSYIRPAEGLLACFTAELNVSNGHGTDIANMQKAHSHPTSSNYESFKRRRHILRHICEVKSESIDIQGGDFCDFLKETLLLKRAQNLLLWAMSSREAPSAEHLGHFFATINMKRDGLWVYKLCLYHVRHWTPKAWHDGSKALGGLWSLGRGRPRHPATPCSFDGFGDFDGFAAGQAAGSAHGTATPGSALNPLSPWQTLGVHGYRFQ